MASREDVDLRSYLSVLRRRKGIIVLTMFLVGTAALMASLAQTPMYEAKAVVLIQAQPSANVGNTETPTGRVEATRTLENEINFAEGDAVKRAVRAATGSSGTVTVSTEADADVLVFTGRARHPQVAADIANLYANTYIDLRRSATVEEFLAYGAVVQRRIDDLRAERERLIGPLGALEQALARVDLRNEIERRQLESQIQVENTRILGQRASLDSQLSSLEATAGDLGLGPQLAGGAAELVREAKPSSSPTVPTTTRNVVMGLTVGMVLGIGLAFVIDQLDDSIRSREELEAAAGVPVVGLIPRVPGWSNKAEPRVVAASDQRSPTAEAYRSLRTAVQFLGLDRSIRTLMITSPSGGEGKTTTTVNLAVTLVLSGLRVAVVDCDLRRSRAWEYFGLPNDRGLTTALAEGIPARQVMQLVNPEIDRLAFVAAGPAPPNPAEILASNRTEALLQELASEVDILLIDAPPVLPVTDALILSAYVDAVLLLGLTNHSTRHDIARAAELLRQVDAPLVGAILNSASGQSGYGGYGTSYAYEPDSPRPRWRRWRRRKPSPEARPTDRAPRPEEPKGEDEPVAIGGG